MTIFGRKTRNDGAQANPEAAQIARDEELAAYWKGRFEKAKDGHETTQVYIDYRNHNLLEWLKDFDRRNARESRAHARQLRGLRDLRSWDPNRRASLDALGDPRVSVARSASPGLRRRG